MPVFPGCQAVLQRVWFQAIRTTITASLLAGHPFSAIVAIRALPHGTEPDNIFGLKELFLFLKVAAIYGIKFNNQQFLQFFFRKLIMLQKLLSLQK